MRAQARPERRRRLLRQPRALSARVYHLCSGPSPLNTILLLPDVPPHPPESPSTQGRGADLGVMLRTCAVVDELQRTMRNLGNAAPVRPRLLPTPDPSPLGRGIRAVGDCHVRQPSGGITSLILTAPKRSDVGSRELKPFPIGATVSEATMPVCFDAGRVISTNGVNERRGLGKGNSDFLHTPLELVASANLVVSAGTHEVNEPILR